MSRVADLAQNKLVRSVILDTQSRLADKQLQISTLQKSQDYAGISSQSSRLVSLETSERRMSQFLTDNTFVNLRMDTMLNSVDSLKTSLKDVRSLLRDLVDDGQLADGINKDDIADIKISEIEDFLNAKVNGRYLFAGSKTEVKPMVPGTMTTAPTYDGSFISSAEPSFYYQGDDTVVKARIDEGVVLNYGVTAAEPAFEKLVRAVRILRSTDITGADADYLAKLQGALDLTNEAETLLQATELGIGTKIQQLDTTNNNIKNSQNFANGLISDIESTNTFEVVAELTQHQTMLEASYNTVVRLSNLTLTRFL
jgi:flagellar hook-associated protein 3 FlgL